MNEREIFEDAADEIEEVGDSLIDYDGYSDKRGDDYDDGWNDAVEHFVLALLGRKSEDGAQLLIQAVKGMPLSSREMICTYCSRKPIKMTESGYPVCNKCKTKGQDHND